MTRSRYTDYLHREPITTLAEIVFRLHDAEDREDLEAYRIEYEAEHGPTDLTRHYTSQMSPAMQAWLVDNEVDRYIEGLPPFARAYMQESMEQAASEGRLDDKPDEFVAAFLRQKRNPPSGGYGR